MVAVNLRAVFVATQAAVKHMPAGGRIINIGSSNAERLTGDSRRNRLCTQHQTVEQFYGWSGEQPFTTLVKGSHRRRCVAGEGGKQ